MKVQRMMRRSREQNTKLTHRINRVRGIESTYEKRAVGGNEPRTELLGESAKGIQRKEDEYN